MLSSPLSRLQLSRYTSKIMLKIKLLGSLFILVVLSNHQAEATIQPQINFDASLEHETSSSALQLVRLQCGLKSGNVSEKDSMSPPVSGTQRQVAVQRSNSMSTVSDGDDASFTFYIVLDDKLSTFTILTNYTSSMHENGNITVTFYIPRQTKFVSKFSCSYNSSNLASSFTNITTELVFVYVPTDTYPYDDTDFVLLFSLFCCLFVLTLILLIISSLCYCRQSRKMTSLQRSSIMKISMYTGNGESRESGTHRDPESGNFLRKVRRIESETIGGWSSASHVIDHLVPSQEDVTVHQPYNKGTELSYPACHVSPHDCNRKFVKDSPSVKTLSSSSGEPLPENAVDDFLKILSHPSPCLSRGCPCSYYKRKLLCNLRQSAMQTQTQCVSSDTSDLSMSMQVHSSVSSQFQADHEVDPGYSSVTSHKPPVGSIWGMQHNSQAAEVDLGYASVGSEFQKEKHLPQERTSAPLECEHYVIKDQPVVRTRPTEKVASNQELLFVTSPAAAVEMEIAQGSSSQTDYHASVDGQCDITVSPASRSDAVNHPAPRSLGGAALPAYGHPSSTLHRDCPDISYPTLYPNIDQGDEVMELSNKFNLDINFIDPIETVQFDSNGGRYANENHEVYVRIPRGAIPEGKTISIEVGLSFHSALVSLLPLESRPVSPLLKLCVVGEPNFRFLKPVEVTLPHFLDIADEEDPNQMGLQFLKSGHSLYCFHKSDGVATFKPRVNTATLKTAHFCTFCITANKSINDKKINYRLVKVVPKNREQREWRANFCVTYYLRTCLQVCADFHHHSDLYADSAGTEKAVSRCGLRNEDPEKIQVWRISSAGSPL